MFALALQKCAEQKLLTMTRSEQLTGPSTVISIQSCAMVWGEARPTQGLLIYTVIIQSAVHQTPVIVEGKAHASRPEV